MAVLVEVRTLKKIHKSAAVRWTDTVNKISAKPPSHTSWTDVLEDIALRFFGRVKNNAIYLFVYGWKQVLCFEVQEVEISGAASETSCG